MFPWADAPRFTFILSCEMFPVRLHIAENERRRVLVYSEDVPINSRQRPARKAFLRLFQVVPTPVSLAAGSGAECC